MIEALLVISFINLQCVFYLIYTAREPNVASKELTTEGPIKRYMKAFVRPSEKRKPVVNDDIKIWQKEMETRND